MSAPKHNKEPLESDLEDFINNYNEDDYICPACDGDGNVNGILCKQCDGKGQK